MATITISHTLWCGMTRCKRPRVRTQACQGPQGGGSEAFASTRHVEAPPTLTREPTTGCPGHTQRVVYTTWFAGPRAPGGRGLMCSAWRDQAGYAAHGVIPTRRRCRRGQRVAGITTVSQVKTGAALHAVSRESPTGVILRRPPPPLPPRPRACAPCASSSSLSSPAAVARCCRPRPPATRRPRPRRPPDHPDPRPRQIQMRS